VISGSRLNPNGKWFFDMCSVGLVSPVQPFNGRDEPESNGVQAIYARVSTRKQLNDLQSQIRILTTKYPDHIVFSDCASGLKRKGLLSLLQLAFEGRLRLVRIAHRDRLCRFAFDLLEYVFLKHCAKIHVEASDLPSSTESEPAEDVLAVITVFGARLHGARSAGRRRKPTQEGEEKGS
jgi:putative resolvase